MSTLPHDADTLKRRLESAHEAVDRLLDRFEGQLEHTAPERRLRLWLGVQQELQRLLSFQRQLLRQQRHDPRSSHTLGPPWVDALAPEHRREVRRWLDRVADQLARRVDGREALEELREVLAAGFADSERALFRSQPPTRD